MQMLQLGREKVEKLSRFHDTSVWQRSSLAAKCAIRYARNLAPLHHMEADRDAALASIF